MVFEIDISTRGGGGVMPYMCHTETCRRSGYTFWPSNPRQGVFFEPDSKTGCQICTITPSQGAYSQYCLTPSHWFQLTCLLSRKLILVLMFSTYLKFYYDIKYKNLLGFPLKRIHFCVLIHCSADCCLSLKQFAPPPKKLV